MQVSPFSSISSLSLCFSCRRRCAAPTALWRASPATSCLQNRPTHRARPPPPLFASRWSFPCRATRPDSPAGRHLAAARGQHGVEPAALSSRAHEHYKYPSKLIRELFRLFLTSTLQNTAAAPLEPRQARPHHRTPSSALPRPHSTSPAAPPCPGAAPPPLLLAQSPPEPPRRRFPSSNSRRSPSMP